MPSLTEKHSGFSLVELSIVLVILGLLVGGVLSGRSLIRAAELRNVTVEYQEYQTAVNTFKTRFRFPPGDLPNATQFWGTTAANCLNWYNTANLPLAGTRGTETCNGNGDGDLRETGGRTHPTVRYEDLTFWQHLSNAGLIAGKFDGSQAAADPYPIRWGQRLGTTWPASKLSGAMWNITHFDRGDGSGAVHWLRFWGAGYVILTPEEAWGIDSKIDDGKPMTGIAQTDPASTNGAADCTLEANGGNWADYTDADAVYHLAHSGIACPMNFRL